MRTKNRWLILAIIAALVSLGMIVAACDDDDGDGNGDANGPPAEASTVDVGLTEFTVSPSPDSTAAGSVTFNLSNDGVTPHSQEGTVDFQDHIGPSENDDFRAVLQPPIVAER